jgi:hypothetical protein
MDLIQALSNHAGLDTDRAQALAGGVLGLVRSAVETQSGAAAAQQVDAAVPELGAWQAAAARLVGGDAGGEAGSGLGALGGLAAQALAGADGGGGGGGLGALGGLAAQALAGGGGGGGGLGGLAAQALAGAGGGGLGALGGLAAQALGGGGLTGLFGKLGLDPSMLGTVAPLVLQFLEGRLPPELLGLAKSALPLLGGAGGSTGGGAGGLLGGLLGGR